MAVGRQMDAWTGPNTAPCVKMMSTCKFALQPMVMEKPAVSNPPDGCPQRTPRSARPWCGLRSGEWWHRCSDPTGAGYRPKSRTGRTGHRWRWRRPARSGSGRAGPSWGSHSCRHRAPAPTRSRSCHCSVILERRAGLVGTVHREVDRANKVAAAQNKQDFLAPELHAHCFKPRLTGKRTAARCWQGPRGQPGPSPICTWRAWGKNHALGRKWAPQAHSYYREWCSRYISPTQSGPWGWREEPESQPCLLLLQLDVNEIQRNLKKRENSG